MKISWSLHDPTEHLVLKPKTNGMWWAADRKNYWQHDKKNWEKWKDNNYKKVTNFYKAFNIKKQENDNL